VACEGVLSAIRGLYRDRGVVRNETIANDTATYLGREKQLKDPNF
jgi:hypothetical protein